ncbi:TOMM precursor leader peptide-binding protein, partial [Allocoleopsis sp.]|uniref:TOMM precursor leader peptide-binding protein n=1 Tax=Allocoleopsis sp. TaxID=3088169 RepID=UPI002FD6C943
MMMRQPRFKSCFRCEIVPSDGVFLISENEHFLLRGDAYIRLAPLLDGKHSVEEIIAILQNDISAPEVFYLLTRLQSKGYIVDAKPTMPSEQAAFWEMLGQDSEQVAQRLQEVTVSVVSLGQIDTEPFKTMLASLGVRVGEGGNFWVVLTDDYLQEGLDTFNQDALSCARAWMLVKPVGIEMWVGPIFIPSKTGCWECLAHRLRGHRKVERYLQQRKNTTQPLPTSLSVLPSTLATVLGMAATETAKWVVCDRNESLEGNIVTLNALSLDKGNHVLIQRPQCPRCGNLQDRELHERPPRACFQTSPPDSDPPQPPLTRGENSVKVPRDIKGAASSDPPLFKGGEGGISSGDLGGSPGLKTDPSPPNLRRTTSFSPQDGGAQYLSPNDVSAQKSARLVLQSRKKSFTRDGGHRSVSPEETFKQFAHHISPITGIIGVLRQASTGEEAGLTPSYTAGYGFVDALDDLDGLQESLRSEAYGKGRSEIQAKVSALCEAIERYTGIFQGDEPRIKVRFKDLGTAIHPNACMLFSDRQFQNRDRLNGNRISFDWIPERFDEDREIEWSPAWSLTYDEPRYIPTAYCYSGYAQKYHALFASADTNGCASGNNLEEAILQGFMELVERDSIALWWYNRLPKPAVELSSFEE